MSSVTDFLTGYAIDRRSYPVENDDRALCVLQDRLVIIGQLFAGVKVEIFARLAAPIDLALAVVIGLDETFQLGKSASASAGAWGAVSFRSTSWSIKNHPMGLIFGPNTVAETNYPAPICPTAENSKMAGNPASNHVGLAVA